MRTRKRNNQYRVSDELWNEIEPLLPKHKNTHRFGGGRPRVPDRQAMDGIFFVLRTGCQWNALNATGICSSSTAHDRFQEWTKAGVFVKFWAKGLAKYDELKGIDWSWQSMDGAMTKAPLGGEKTGPNPTDRAKKGVKRSVLAEASGVPIGLAVDGANRHDSKMVEATILSIPVKRPKATKRKPQGMCLDKGYDYDSVRDLIKEFGYTAHVKARGEEAQAIKRQAGFKARRWVVERTHSWMNRFRRILTRWEKKPTNYLALLHLVCAVITFRCAGLFG
ncbi:MAG TPA: IS5 family transposase [Phycisphaerales bacterium]|nr:IS5 family transposase [Phycisphaerales bacterium]